MSEIIIFCGIPASGKTSFYSSFFYNTHIHISLDILNTRKKEERLFISCLENGRKCVIDNTNVLKAERQKYILLGKQFGFKIIGYYFSSKVSNSILRNKSENRKSISEIAIKAKAKQLELPSLGEGFDALFFVSLSENKFEVNIWEKL